MGKHSLWVVFFLSVLVLGGCALTGRETGLREEKDIVDENEYEEAEVAMEKVVLTEQEEKLLCDLYVDEKRIREGRLYGYQLECLEQIRFGMNYLENKYQGKSFTFLTCNPKNKANPRTVILFYGEDAGEKEFALVIESGDGVYQASDNYYGYLINEAYDQAVTEKLIEAGMRGCITYTKFHELHGKGIDGKLTSDEIFAMGAEMGRSTDVFLDHENGDLEKNNQIVEKVKEIMMQNNLYGSYNVYLIPGIMEEYSSGAECEEYVKENQRNSDIYTASFNCFDLG